MTEAKDADGMTALMLASLPRQTFKTLTFAQLGDGIPSSSGESFVYSEKEQGEIIQSLLAHGAKYGETKRCARKHHQFIELDSSLD